MPLVELKTAAEVRAHARAVARRMAAQRVIAPPPAPKTKKPKQAQHHIHPALKLQEDRVRLILDVVAQHYLLEPGDFVRLRVSRGVLFARSLAIYIARKMGASFLLLSTITRRDCKVVRRAFLTIEERLERGEPETISVVTALLGKVAAALQEHH